MSFHQQKRERKKSYEIITFANPDSALTFYLEEQFLRLVEIVTSDSVNSSRAIICGSTHWESITLRGKTANIWWD